MSDTRDWRRLLRLPGRDARDTVDEEIAAHLAMLAADLERAGLSPVAARAEAERQFGELEAIRGDCVTIERRRRRRGHRRETMKTILDDVTYALRAMRKSPAFSIAALICIALGVGVTTTIFSAVLGVLIRPLPYSKPDQLVSIYAEHRDRGERKVNISYADYLSWREANHSFSQLGIWTWTTLSFTGDGEPERLEGAAVAANLFPLLGVSPAIGRTFTEDEERRGNDHVVLLGHGLWQRRYAGDSSIVGRSIAVNGSPYRVVGIMPAGFGFPDAGQAWVPFESEDPSHGNRQFAGAIGRLKPGVTVASAQADLNVITKRLTAEFPRDMGWDAQVISLREDLVGPMRDSLLVFFAAVLLVLLVACANVANLMLARGAARQRELAVRAALGAGRSRLVRQLLTESVVLALIGGVAGAALSVVGVRLLRVAFPNNVPFYFTLGVSPATLTFAIALSVIAGVVFGVMPAFRASALSLADGLREGGRAGTAGSSSSRLRSSLVVAEVALSVMLMIGAGLLIKSYRALNDTRLGFDRENLLTFRTTLPAAQYGDGARRLAFYQALRERIAALPGVVDVGSAQGIPFAGWNTQAGMSIQGRPAARPGDELVSLYQFVSPEFLRTLGVPLVRGRWLTPADRDTVAVVALINQSFAAKAFPGEDPIGKRVRIGDERSTEPWGTVVGVVGDYRHYQLPQPMGPAIYYPLTWVPQYSQTTIVRVRGGDPTALVPSMRRIVHELDANVPLYRVQTMEENVAASLWRARLQSQVLGTFAVLALVLASVGIYGVISYGVAQRTRELGVRVALGASSSDVTGLIVRQGASLAAIGIVIGLAGAFALAGTLRTLLVGVSTMDPGVFAGVPVLLAAVAIVASYVPARRATKIDPLVAMRPD